MAEIETTHETKVMYVGRLGDLGLGNPEGIPSELSEASESELKTYGEKLKGALDTITDHAHDGCIDGRRILHNGDHSKPEVRARQVSGTGSLLEDAYNADAPVLKTIDAEAELGDEIKVLETLMEDAIGLKPSAHQGGCGGVGGAVEDNEAIGAKPQIMQATETFMNLPVVSEFTNLAFNHDLGQKVVQNAPRTAEHLKAGGWHGQTYVDGAAGREPAGTEILETAEDTFHGHKEKAVVFVLSSRGRSTSEALLQELELGDVFVVTVQRSVEKAHVLAGERGFEGAQQALIANIAKHMAVADRLPSDKTPVYIIKDY